MGAPRPAGLLWRSLLLLGLLVAARCDAGPGSDAWCEDLDWCDCCNDEGSWNVRLRGGADLFDVHTGGDASWPPAGGPANASDACRDVVLFTAHTQAPGERATRFDFAAPGAGLGGNATAELTFPELVHVVNCGYAALHGHGFQFVPVAAGTSRRRAPASPHPPRPF